MGLFKNRNTLKKRVQSLEEHLGVIYTTEDGYGDHLNREYGVLPNLTKDVKELKAKKK